jgi:hypothetical protein
VDVQRIGKRDRCCFFCSFPEDQPGHGLPRFAKLGMPRTHSEPLGPTAYSFLNRGSEVRWPSGAGLALSERSSHANPLGGANKPLGFERLPASLHVRLWRLLLLGASAWTLLTQRWIDGSSVEALTTARFRVDRSLQIDSTRRRPNARASIGNIPRSAGRRLWQNGGFTELCCLLSLGIFAP